MNRFERVLKVVPPVKKYAPAHSYSSTPKVKLVEGFGKGLMSDIKRKAPFLVSDFTDGLSIKVLSSIFFLFFACLAPAVAFGGMLGIATSGAMGTIEASRECNIYIVWYTSIPVCMVVF